MIYTKDNINQQINKCISEIRTMCTSMKDFLEDENKIDDETYEEALIEGLRRQTTDIVRNAYSFTALRPLQLMSMVSEQISKTSNLLGNVINLRGVYLPNNKGTLYKGYCYDLLRDENNNATITIIVPAILRNKLKQDKVVVLAGMLVKKLDGAKGQIEVQFRVDSIVEEVKDAKIDPDDLKRLALVKEKGMLGKKAVTALLKGKIMKGERPKVCLVYAAASFTDMDFEKGVKSAATEIDFYADKSTAFSNADKVVLLLKTLDTKGYDSIALVRGGGDGLEQLDNVKILDCVLHMKTPTLGGAGHVGDKLWLHSIVDENPSTPSLLGQYFSDLVSETVAERTGTLSDLQRKIAEQYKPQLARLAQLENTTKEDKAQIKELIKESTKIAEKNTELNKEIQKIERAMTSSIKDAEARAEARLMAQARGWMVVAIISLIALAVMLMKTLT